MGKEISSENDLFPVTRKYIENGLTLEELFALEVRASKFQPILVDLIQRIAERKRLSALIKDFEQDRFSQVSRLSQREIIKLEEIFYLTVPARYESVELSPVAPLGINSVLTKVSQRSVLSTVRNVEVLADPTTLFALECARRRRLNTKGSSKEKFSIDLCSSVRCIRGQLFDGDSSFTPHFHLFAMGSGGLGSAPERDQKMFEHISILLDFLTSPKTDEAGYEATNIQVQISDIRIMEEIIKIKGLNRKELGIHSQDNNFELFSLYGIDLPTVVDDLSLLSEDLLQDYGLVDIIKWLRQSSIFLQGVKEKYPKVSFGYDIARIAGIGYYNGPCFKITACNKDSETYPLADGGYSDWLGKLLSNHRVFYFSSGFGLELFAKFFKRL